jgi:peptidoglycan/LPS O-acetylase OafA/YrhL
MTAILEPPTVTTGSPAPVVRRQPVLPPAPEAATPPPPAPPPAPPAAPREKPVLTPTGIRLLGAAMVALFVLGVVIEPAADGPQPVLSLAEEIIATVMTLFMVGALAGFLRGRRWALGPALGFGGLLAVNVALCPTTGHHQLAGWWFGQVVIGAAMVALPAAALLRTRAG